jgi:hypothetical protein
MHSARSELPCATTSLTRPAVALAVGKGVAGSPDTSVTSNCWSVVGSGRYHDRGVVESD